MMSLDQHYLTETPNKPHNNLLTKRIEDIDIRSSLYNTLFKIEKGLDANKNSTVTMPKWIEYAKKTIKQLSSQIKKLGNIKIAIIGDSLSILILWYKFS
jgi:hypothetical protein